MATFVINTDGGARGNPGSAGAGIVIADSTGKVLEEFSKELGTATNNQAEYWALIFALERVQSLIAQHGDAGVSVAVRMDSELIVRQLTGQYKVKNPGLQSLYDRAAGLVAALGGTVVTFQHVPRRENKRADELANEAMDRVQAAVL